MSPSRSSQKSRPRADLAAPGLQDGRYGRFGLWVGIGVALAAHLIFFALPRPGSLEETEGETERGMVARTYRQRAFIPGTGAGEANDLPLRPPAPRAPDRTPRSGESAGGGVEPQPEGAQAQFQDGSQTEAPLPGAGGSSFGGDDSAGGSRGTADSGEVAEETPPPSRQVAARLDSDNRFPPSGAPTGQNGRGGAQDADWERMMAALKGEEREGTPRGSSTRAAPAAPVPAPAAKAKPAPARAAEAEDSAGLDRRIRMTVVSYPPTSIEKKFPPIPYPEVAVARRNLAAGICRVYLRLWIDGSGVIVREELKAPSSEEERAMYEPFIRAVREAAREWQFDSTQAQVHVDVLFEIK